MATTDRGAIVRTTHRSGMFTDLGIMLGHALRGMPVARRRLALCVLIIGFFFIGGVLGAWLFARAGYGALYVPAVLTGITGLGYFLYRQLRGGGTPYRGATERMSGHGLRDTAAMTRATDSLPPCDRQRQRLNSSHYCH